MAYSGQERRKESKADQIIWQVMMGSCALLIAAAAAWANAINSKVDKIVNLEVKIQYLQTDISEIKSIMKSYIVEKNNFK